MESQPQNPEFRINPENFHPCRNSFQVSEKNEKLPSKWKVITTESNLMFIIFSFSFFSSVF